MNWRFSSGQNWLFSPGSEWRFSPGANTDLDGNEKPSRDVTAYILRRDWCTRACNVCGLTSDDVDYLMGHAYDKGLIRRDYVSPDIQGEIAKKLENYVYLPSHSRHPYFSPLAIEQSGTTDLPEAVACSIENTSSEPMRVTLDLRSLEPGVTVKIKSDSPPVKFARRRSIPDSPEQRQMRVPIGRIYSQDYYDQLAKNMDGVTNDDEEKKWVD